MVRRARWAALVAGVALFVLGAVAGAIAMRVHDLRAARAWIQTEPAERRARLIVFALERQLEMNPLQIERLEDVLRGQATRVRQAHAQGFAERQELRAELRRQLGPELTSEQKKRLDELVQAANRRDRGVGTD